MKLSDIDGHSTRPKLVVDTSALQANYRHLDKLSGKARIGASVKADGYGLGLEAVGKALYGAGCRAFFVATAGEGRMLREAVGENPTIYVLNGPAPQDLALFFKSDLRPVLNTVYQVRLWEDAATAANRAPYSALMIDTGMNRLGVSETDIRALGKPVWDRVGLDHVMSHLACADTPDHPMNAKQLKAFKRLSTLLPPKTMSLANSAGVYLGKPYHFQMVRPGIALYGGRATPGEQGTQPVASIEATVLQVREVKAGETVGYDATFTAETDMRVAVIGAGYADGIPVAVSNAGGLVTLNGKTVRIVGRVSMDLTCVDVSRIRAKVGDTASFLGPNLSRTAEAAGTIDYELLVRLGQRLRRDYRRGTPSPGGRGAPRGGAGARRGEGRGPKGRAGSPPRGTAPARRSSADAARSRPSRDRRSGPPKGRPPRS